jgi:lipid A 3-O-deacylase
MRRIVLRVVISLSLLAAFLVSLAPSKAMAAPQEEKPYKWLREIGLLTGYGSASLTKKASDYEVIPLLPQFGFDINPLAKKLHIEPKGTFEGIIEPIMNIVTHPDANAEVGCSFFLKYSQKITSRIAPYIEGGLGMVYTTQHTHEQGTQYNFLTQAGIGLQFFLTDQWALTGGYRFRHLSNAGIDEDNEGINHHFGLVGVSYFFK